VISALSLQFGKITTKSMVSKRGIVLMNLGSPDSTSVKDVKKYLIEFLMDKRVIDKPFLFRYLLVRGIIVPFRAPKSAHAYRSVWTEKGAPLVLLTRELEKLVQASTADTVEIAMRYGNPSPQEAFDNLLRRNPRLEEVVLLPLYPHYAASSYETAVVYAEEIYKKQSYPFRLRTVPVYYNNAHYIQALAAGIKPYLAQPFDKIIFSYHGVPERHISNGDTTGCHCLKTENCCQTPSLAHRQCYRHQTFETTRLVKEMLQLPDDMVEQTFQSRLGRDPWLRPYTAQRLTELPAEGVKKLLVVCPAFVSDCLETLEEIAIVGKASFLASGGTSFTAIPCLNTHPQWVETILKLVD
jgi:ferrochelatase